jgi:cell division protein FtsZ
MPVDLNKILQTIRRDAGFTDEVTVNGTQQPEPLIQIEALDEAKHEPLIESAGETYGRLISVCFAGVGTCGVNILMSLKAQNEKNEMVEFVGINSDGGSIKELEKNGFNHNIPLSMGDSYYLGAGGDLETAKELGKKHFEDFEKVFKDVDLALVVTGMGGGTGTGVAPLVAKAAKEAQKGKRNKLTIGVATMPSGIEADRREIAMQGMEELKKYVDALIVIDMINILEVLDQENASVNQADDLIDSRFQIVLQSIMDTVTKYTKRNIDFADVCSTLKACGDAIITTVEASAANVEDIKKELAKALSDKLLINHSDKIASRLMIYQFYEPGYSEKAHYEVVSEVQKLFNWTKKGEYSYSCVLENAPENTVKFLKIGNGSGEEFKGKTKVIVMAGGFVNKHVSPLPAVSPPPREPARVIAPTRVLPAVPPGNFNPLVTTPLSKDSAVSKKPEQIPLPSKGSSIENLLNEGFSL